MKTSINGRQLIEQFEGLILQSYDDADDRIVQKGGSAKGTLTIGYGHTSAAGAPRVVPGMKITKAQADSILASDLTAVENTVNKLVKVKLNQNQYDAVVSFEFNTGSLGKSSLLKCINKGDFKGAAEAFMLYTKGRVNGQLVQMEGLIKRRRAEQVLFMKPSITAPVVGSAAAIGIGATISQFWHSHETAIIIGSVLTAIAVGTAIYFYLRKTK